MAQLNNTQSWEEKLQAIADQQEKILATASPRWGRFWLTVGLSTLLSAGINAAATVLTHRDENRQAVKLQNTELEQRDSVERQDRTTEALQNALTLARILQDADEERQTSTVLGVGATSPRTAIFLVAVLPTTATHAALDSLRT